MAGPAVALEDGLGREILIDAPPERVVALSGSLGEAWMNAGGSLAGVTDDADFSVPEGVRIVGGTHQPSLEAVLALEPDLVIASAAQAGHRALADSLDEMGIPAAYFEVNTYREYLAMMKTLTGISGVPERYRAALDAVETPIEDTIARARCCPGFMKHTCVLLRAYSTGVKAKGSGNLAGAILQDMGFVNLADGGALLEDVTLEEIVVADPDFIFITTMGGDEQAALGALKRQFEENPAWAHLSCVKGDKVFVLPRDLFHQKPNSRWAESYRYIEALAYAD